MWHSTTLARARHGSVPYSSRDPSVSSSSSRLLREGREWPDSAGRQGGVDPSRAGLLDEDSAPAVDLHNAKHRARLSEQYVPRAGSGIYATQTAGSTIGFLLLGLVAVAFVLSKSLDQPKLR
jgi:hypothetical protein